MSNPLSTFTNAWMTKLLSLLFPFIKTKFQTKTLSANVSIIGVLTDLTFNNLVSGKVYRVSGEIHGNTFGITDVKIIHGLVNIRNIRVRNIDIDNSFGIVFVATASTVTFDVVTANGTIGGDGTTEQTHAIIEELPNHEETADFS